MPVNNGGKLQQKSKHELDLRFFVNEYHDLKLIQKLSIGQTWYHSAKYMVPTGDIISALNYLSLATTKDHIHINQLMRKTRQMMVKNKNLMG